MGEWDRITGHEPPVQTEEDALAAAFERGRQAERTRLIPAPHEIEHPLVWQQGYYSGLLVSHPEAVRKTAERIAAWHEQKRWEQAYTDEFALKIFQRVHDESASKCRALAKGGEGEAE